MTKADRRYFVAEGPEAEAIKQKVLDTLTEQRRQHNELAEKYGADQVLRWNDGRVAGFAFKAGPGDIVERDGLKFDRRESNGDSEWLLYSPNKRSKLGKQIAADMAAIKGYSGSDEIVQHYGAYRISFVRHQGPTGQAMAISVAGIIKGTVVLSVPVNEQEPFDPPAGLREIKKSEYIALTEE